MAIKTCVTLDLLYYSVGTVLVTPASTTTSILPTLPDEHDTFEEIRLNNKVYVDKTAFVATLLQSEHRFLRLCRPGRFGKSNFLQMLKSFFEGERKLFEGLSAVRDTTHDWRPYPVIHLDFGNANVKTMAALKAELSGQIVRAGERYGVKIDERLPVHRAEVPPAYFRDRDVPEDCVLIRDTCPSGRLMVPKLPIQTQLGQLVNALTNNGTLPRSVVVLVDEYDWPVRRVSSNYGLFGAGNSLTSDDFGTFLETFFYQFVHMEASIKLLLMTCTSKLCLSGRPTLGEKYGLDSSPLFRDISMDARFVKMMGLTEEEMRSALFRPYIDAMVISRPNETVDTVHKRLRKRYNGYNFLPDRYSNQAGDVRLYNFHSVMMYLKTGGNYFGHPAALAKYALEKDGPRSTPLRMPIRLFGNYTIPRYFMEKSYEYDDLIPMGVSMVQHGYLTLVDYDRRTDEFIVGFPNDEMRKSFQREYLSADKTSLEDFLESSNDLRDSLKVQPQKMQSSDIFNSSEILRIHKEYGL